LIDAQNPAGAHVILRGEGNRRGRSLGVATLLSRALPRRDTRKASAEQLAAAFAAEREDVTVLADRARAALTVPCRELEEICTTLTDVRLEERAQEHVAKYVPPSLALERIAGEVARSLAQHGPAARRGVDIEGFWAGSRAGWRGSSSSASAAASWRSRCTCPESLRCEAGRPGPPAPSAPRLARTPPGARC